MQTQKKPDLDIFTCHTLHTHTPLPPKRVTRRWKPPIFRTVMNRDLFARWCSALNTQDLVLEKSKFERDYQRITPFVFLTEQPRQHMSLFFRSGLDPPIDLLAVAVAGTAIRQVSLDASAMTNDDRIYFNAGRYYPDLVRDDTRFYQREFRANVSDKKADLGVEIWVQASDWVTTWKSPLMVQIRKLTPSGMAGAVVCEAEIQKQLLYAAASGLFLVDGNGLWILRATLDLRRAICGPLFSILPFPRTYVSTAIWARLIYLLHSARNSDFYLNSKPIHELQSVSFSVRVGCDGCVLQPLSPNLMLPVTNWSELVALPVTSLMRLALRILLFQAEVYDPKDTSWSIGTQCVQHPHRSSKVMLYLRFFLPLPRHAKKKVWRMKRDVGLPIVCGGKRGQGEGMDRMYHYIFVSE
jgi:hypothetical protein